MDRLKADFGEEIEFIDLNVDNNADRDRMRDYGLTGRSQYLLLDGSGETWEKWFGILDEGAMVAALTEFLVEDR